MKRTIEKRNGYILITPDGLGPAKPMVCPNCNMCIATRDDVASYHSLGCCSWCERMWASGDRRIRWLEGWRPTRESVQATLEGLDIRTNDAGKIYTL